jgi:hypothetical protein
MKQDIVSRHGWERNLRLANDHLELLVTLDVGPRILSLCTPGGENVFKTYDDQLGGRGEGDWKIRGGHRFWIAPEDPARSYHFDNQPVEHRVVEATGEVVVDSVQEAGGRILKSLGITMDPKGPRVAVRHTARNIDSTPLEFSVWALSVMAPGGIEIIPQPALGEHPRDYLPTRGMIIWPYTDLGDPRWHFGREVFTLRQSEGYPPTKIGLPHRERWIAYVVGETVFVKTFEFLEGESYPDGGCNFETFSNSEMLEIESLSPMRTLAPGEEITHIEQWSVLPVDTEILIESEEALGQWIAPFLTRSGLV